VVANLPYNITSDALKRMLPMGDHISHLILMVQYEAAERLVSSSAGDGDYRPISVRVHFYSEPTFIRKVREAVAGLSHASFVVLR
jgi:16S rRNA A1518/A1519 N6-dimethyltransferase RsmA/KsgA/DIM1 with predicted DNA glycosylase/AP lyase activity